LNKPFTFKVPELTFNSVLNPARGFAMLSIPVTFNVFAPIIMRRPLLLMVKLAQVIKPSTITEPEVFVAITILSPGNGNAPPNHVLVEDQLPPLDVEVMVAALLILSRPKQSKKAIISLIPMGKDEKLSFLRIAVIFQY
jgi:hypothetical protein